jgi:uncharacterized protein YdcH (DUF465 family)
MNEDISASLLAFYEKVLEPEFRSIKEKLREHDDKFARILDRCDAAHQRFKRMESERETIRQAVNLLENAIDLQHKTKGAFKSARISAALACVSFFALINFLKPAMRSARI